MKVKENKLMSLENQLEKSNKQLEASQQTVRRLESSGSSSGSVCQTPTRRASMTPHKRDSSITIGTSADIDSQEKIAELERKLAEKEQETKDLEVKLFEASFTNSAATKNIFDEDAPLPSRQKSSFSFNEDAPLPARQKTASRTLFDEEPMLRPHETRTDNSSQNIASRHKVKKWHVSSN